MTEPQWTNEEKLALTLSFVAMCGCAVRKVDDIRDAIVEGLGTFAPDHELVWGPATHRPTMGRVTDACMILVRQRETGQYTLVVRGTPPPSVSSWLFQVCAFMPRVAWRKLSPKTEAPEGALVSHGTKRTMSLLTSDELDFPSDATDTRSLQALMVGIARKIGPKGVLRIAGHSLGGVGGPLVALWLSEQLDAPPTMHTFSYAGPTAGNAPFALYSDSVIAKAPNRLRCYRNALDFACSCWNATAMRSVTDLYRETGKAHLPEFCEDAFMNLLARLGYTRLCNGVDVPSEFTEDTHTIPTEEAWQHICAYPLAFLDEATAVALLETILGHAIEHGNLSQDDKETFEALQSRLRSQG